MRAQDKKRRRPPRQPQDPGAERSGGDGVPQGPTPGRTGQHQICTERATAVTLTEEGVGQLALGGPFQVSVYKLAYGRPELSW